MKKNKFNVKHLKGVRAIFCDSDANVVGETYKYALNGIKEELRFFGLPDEFPLVNIFIAPDRREYDRMVSHLTKIPTGKGRLGQPQGHDFYLISPNAWPADAHTDYLGRDGEYDKKVYRQFIRHEIAHMIAEYHSPKGAMEIRPRWWNEGMAVYASGQWKDRITRKLLKADLAAGRIPVITGMTTRDAYVWGWTLVRFIEKRFGRGALNRIIRESRTKDIPGFLKLRRREFESEWKKTAPESAREAVG